MVTRRSHWDYTIEVCIVCGCQLSRGDTRAGRCIDPTHGSRGGMVVRVTPRPLAEQDDRSTQAHWLSALATDPDAGVGRS